MAKVNFDHGKVLADISGKRKSMYVISSSTIIHSMTEMSLSLQAPQRRQINSGENFRNCRKRSVLRAAFLIWRQKWFPD